jgi:uncharacterized protein (DUF1778 family)
MSSFPGSDRTFTRDVTINIRAQQRQRDLIDQAAEISGKNRSDFMLEASCQRAQEVLLDQRLFVLSDEKWQEFLAILDAPVQANDKLKTLLETSAPWEL